MRDRDHILKDLRRRHSLPNDARVGTQAVEIKRSTIRVKGGDDSGPMRVSAIASTASVDLADEVLIPSGAKLDTFRAYKSILYEHDPGWVLGRLVDVNYNRANDHIFASFDILADACEENRRVAYLIREGAINGVSVGFRRLSWGPPTEADGEKMAGAYAIVREWEMLELSIVALPCNRDAIIQEVKSARLSKDTAIRMGVPKEAFAFDGKPVLTLRPKKSTPTLKIRTG